MGTCTRMAVCGLVAAAGLGLSVSGVHAQDKATPSAPPARAAAKAGAVDLTPKYTPGQEMKFTVDLHWTEMLRVQAGADKSDAQVTTSEHSMGVTLRVKEVSEAATVLEMTVDSLRSRMELAHATYEYDSAKSQDDKDRENPAYRGLSPVIGTVLTIELDSEGNVVQVSGGDRIAAGGQMAGEVRRLVGAEQTKLRWDPILSVKDGGGSAAAGDTWKDETVIKAPPLGQIRIATTSTLESIDGQKATIKATGMTDLLPLAEDSKLAFKVKESRFERTIVWDAAAGAADSVEQKRSETLDGSAQGLPVQRTSEERMTATRAR